MSEVNWNLLAGIGKSYNDSLIAAQENARRNELYAALDGLGAKAQAGSLTVDDIAPVLARTGQVGALAPLLLQRQQMKNDERLLGSPEMGGTPQASAAPAPAGTDDVDLATRMVMAEAGNQGAIGKAAVAHVMKNRLADGGYGKTLTDIITAPKQFTPWATRRQELLSYDPSSPAYQDTRKIVQGVLDGSIADPTKGATHFAQVETSDPVNQQGWIAQMQRNGSVKIGAHTFGRPDSQPGRVQVADNSGRTVAQRSPQAGESDEGGDNTPATASAAPKASQPLVTIPPEAQQLETAASKLEAQAGNAAYSDAARAAATARAKALRDRAKLYIEAANRAPDTATVSKSSRLINTRTGEEIAAQGGQEAVDQEKLAEKRAEAQAKAEAEQLQRGNSAQTLLPIVERARAAYEKASKLGAIGPNVGSDLNRTIARRFSTPGEVARQEYEAALKDLELRRSDLLKGQGAVTDFERKLVAAPLPQIDSADPKIGLDNLADLKATAEADLKALKNNPLAGPTTLRPQPQAQAGWVDVGGGIKVRRK